MNERLIRKMLSLVLVFSLVFSNFPMQAFATGYGNETTPENLSEDVLVDENNNYGYSEETTDENDVTETNEEGTENESATEGETNIEDENLPESETDIDNADEEVEVEDDVEVEVEVEAGVVVARRTPVVPEQTHTAEATDGVYSHRNWDPEYEPQELFQAARARLAPDQHLFGATSSQGTAGEALFGDISIESVRVLHGGQYQTRFRDQVGFGYEVYQGESGNWYTTSNRATLMDGREFTIHTTIEDDAIGELSYEEFLESLNYTYGDLNFNQWLGSNQFNNPSMSFIHLTGDELVTNEDGTYTLISTVEFRSPYPAANPANVNIPWENYRGTNQQGFSNAMRRVVGTFDLTIHAGSNRIGALPIHLNLYDDFHLWNEVDGWARDLREEAGGNLSINGRHVEVSSLGTAPAGNEIWNIVVAENQAAVTDYFTRTRPRLTGSLEDLLSLRTEIENGVHHRIPIFFNNIHPDEVSGVDAQLIMVEQLLREDYITFETVAEEDTHGLTTGALWGTASPHPNGYVSVGRDPLQSREDTVTVTLSVEEALRDFIFIFVPTNNPDGHDTMFRSNSYGLDLNRDASYQTQMENRVLVQNVLKWHPLAMLEFHGHVAHMLIEPTTGPHNPNFEYDLLQPAMLEAAHVMGRASIAGAYNRYLIPGEHMTHGWDDGGPMYMPIFLMHFGILGFTLEIPHTNQDSLDANIAMGWAFVDHAQENFDSLLLNKIEHNRRGITNADYADLVDPFFRNPFTSPPTQLGRPREEGQSFFPDYWVLPVDAFNQRNALEAFTMLEKFERHDVTIKRTTNTITYNGTTFPRGTYVIDMNQAHRGYVNTMLETGYNASFFTSMYAEITMNFPDLRGFDAKAIWEKGLFDGNISEVTNVGPPETTLPSQVTDYVVVSNNNQDVIRLVNHLLRDGVEVHMLTSYAREGVIGDFVVARSALTGTRLANRFVEVTAIDSVPANAEVVVQPRIALTARPRPAMQGINTPVPFVLQDLGFEYTWVTSNANLLALTPNTDFNIILNHNENWAGVSSISDSHDIPVIAVQSGGAAAAVNGLFGGRGAAGTGITASREGTFRASYSLSSMLTPHYATEDAAYLIGAMTFSAIPSGTTPLITIADGDFEDIFLGGWWQGAANQANVAGRVTAFTGESNDGNPVTVFGSNIFNRAHTQMYHNMFATAAFMHVSDVAEQARPFVNVTTRDAVTNRIVETWEDRILALCQIGLMSNFKEISIRGYPYRGLFIQSSRLSHLS